MSTLESKFSLDTRSHCPGYSVPRPVCRSAVVRHTAATGLGSPGGCTAPAQCSRSARETRTVAELHGVLHPGRFALCNGQGHGSFNVMPIVSFLPHVCKGWQAEKHEVRLV